MSVAIASHVLDAGYALTVHAGSRAEVEPLIARGATWADTPAEAAKDADLIITMVGGPTDVEDAYLGAQGVLATVRKGAYLVDLTTSSPRLARELHDAAEVMDCYAFDCPLIGGKEEALAGTLTLAMGADERYAQPVMPVMETFSSKAFYFGHAGAGQMAKLCDQVSFASCMVGWADALAFAREGGLDEEQTLDLLQVGMGSSAALHQYAGKAAEGDWKSDLPARALHADISLALAEAEELQVTLPGTETDYLLLDTLCQVGGAELGAQAVALLYADEVEGAAAGIDWSALPVADEDAHEHHHHHHH